MKCQLLLPISALVLLFCGYSCPADPTAAKDSRRLRLLTPSGYLPQMPMLVRVEVIDLVGQRDWMLWDGEAVLSCDTPGISLSTNRVVLRNGLGSTLVTVFGAEDINLIASADGLQTNRVLQALTNPPVRSIGGLLPGPGTTWNGVILITNDVIVPLGHTLTIESNTIILIQGVTNGTVANDIAVSGTLLSLGTEDHPVTITCAEADQMQRWGQIRHNNARPSVYRFTNITRGGRSNGEGHTGTAPVIRVVGSKITFESCSITDLAEPLNSAPDFGMPGKIMQASLGSDITFDNCLLARARMGPEISETALLMTNSYIIGMYGENDSDGLFLDAQRPGQSITLSGCVIADGDDDGIDTLKATFTVENCIIRDWRNPLEDSKGISVEGGEARILRSLLVDDALGLSGKGSDGETVRVQIDHSTILAESYALGATNKSGTSPVIDYRVTNSILRGISDSIFTQYNPADIHITYSDLGESWPGVGNRTGDPVFMDAGAHDYRLQPHSPCIDAGDPTAPLNLDGSRTDIGYFTFLPPSPILGNPRLGPDGTLGFQLTAYPNRQYVIEVSSHLPVWNRLGTFFQTRDAEEFNDRSVTNAAMRFYRARLAP